MATIVTKRMRSEFLEQIRILGSKGWILTSFYRLEFFKSTKFNLLRSEKVELPSVLRHEANTHKHKEQVCKEQTETDLKYLIDQAFIKAQT